MVPVVEDGRVQRWLYDKLANDATLAALIGGVGSARVIARKTVPADVADPYVQFHLQSPGIPLMTMGGYRVWSDMLYLVRAVSGGDQGSSVTVLEPIADRVDAVLHRARGPVAGTPVTIRECLRVQDYADESTDENTGHVWSYLGGVYQIKAQSA